MDKKKILKFALGLLVACQLSVCSAEDYQEELTLPVGAAFDLEMDDEINGMDYDAKLIAIEKRNNREVPVLKQAGDTIVTIYFKKDGGGSEPVKFLLHALPTARYNEVTDEHGDVKLEYQEFYDKKAYEARKKKEAATGKNTTKPAKASDKAKPTTPAKANTSTPITPNKPVITTGKPGAGIVNQPTTTKPITPVATNQTSANTSRKPVITTGKPETKPSATAPAQANITPSKAPATTTSAPKAPAVVSNKPTTSASAAAPATKVAVKEVYPENGTFSQQLVYLVNEERSKNNLASVKLAEDMLKLTNIRAEEITNYFSHGRPNGSQFSTIFGNNAPKCGEILGSGHNNSRSLFAAWLRNPANRATLLDPGFKEMAVGHTFKENTAHKHYWVALFRG